MITQRTFRAAFVTIVTIITGVLWHASAIAQAPSGAQMEQMRKRFVGRRPDLDSMRRLPSDLGLSWERFEATNPQGTRIAGWWMPATAARASIVMVHGGEQNKSAMLGRAAALVAAGYNVAVIDLRARGESGGEESDIGPGAASDVVAAADALIATHRHHDRPLVAYGFSHGARTVLFAAASSSRFDAVIAESPPFSLSAGLQRQLKLPFAFPLPEGDLRDAFRALRAKPVLLMLGDADPEITQEQAQSLFTGNSDPASMVVVFPGTGHGVFTQETRERFGVTVTSFLSAQTSRVRAPN